ncbi:hypothetical protein LYZ86_19185 [Xanthomonas hortorum pv. cynarae]|uniref:hypothetical protein n=1 Tax=Xanthomonas hortorum TaxID=56454 RepID=UPI001F449C10|nr:hypothetical protein [Xanthomonas hortorum]MCC4626960.1 hypothetical protein [Xanthomonas campestris pv. nigromaculans]MCE4351321.1 hypothetical protein [Xanthomonas hortorum pv. cynarae]
MSILFSSGNRVASDCILQKSYDFKDEKSRITIGALETGITNGPAASTPIRNTNGCEVAQAT